MAKRGRDIDKELSPPRSSNNRTGGYSHHDSSSGHHRSNYRDDERSNRGRYGDNRYRAPPITNFLSFGEFARNSDQKLGRPQLLEEYEKYKVRYENENKERFFEEHKKEKWFIDLYEPTRIKEKIAEKEEIVRINQEQFLRKLEEGIVTYKVVDIFPPDSNFIIDTDEREGKMNVKYDNEQQKLMIKDDNEEQNAFKDEKEQQISSQQSLAQYSSQSQMYRIMMHLNPSQSYPSIFTSLPRCQFEPRDDLDDLKIDIKLYTLNAYQHLQRWKPRIISPSLILLRPKEENEDRIENEIEKLRIEKEKEQEQEKQKEQEQEKEQDQDMEDKQNSDLPNEAAQLATGIFVDRLPLWVTKEILAVHFGVNGFLFVVLSDPFGKPQYDLTRRGWIMYDSEDATVSAMKAVPMRLYHPQSLSLTLQEDEQQKLNKDKEKEKDKERDDKKERSKEDKEKVYFDMSYKLHKVHSPYLFFAPVIMQSYQQMQNDLCISLALIHVLDKQRNVVTQIEKLFSKEGKWEQMYWVDEREKDKIRREKEKKERLERERIEKEQEKEEEIKKQKEIDKIIQFDNTIPQQYLNSNQRGLLKTPPPYLQIQSNATVFQQSSSSSSSSQSSSLPSLDVSLSPLESKFVFSLTPLLPQMQQMRVSQQQDQQSNDIEQVQDKEDKKKNELNDKGNSNINEDEEKKEQNQSSSEDIIKPIGEVDIMTLSNQYTYQSLIPNSLFSLRERLDRCITYLRDVHNYCYYCGIEYDNEEDMRERCGIIHARANNEEVMQAQIALAQKREIVREKKQIQERSEQIKQENQIDRETAMIKDDDKTNGELNEDKKEGVENVEQKKQEDQQQQQIEDKLSQIIVDQRGIEQVFAPQHQEWASGLHQLHQQRLKFNPNNCEHEIRTGEKLQKNIEEEFYKKKIIEEKKDTKYGCSSCNKKFRTYDFVVKHIQNKHPV
ncbi:MAG: hypothetical protein EZS28_005120 [Streblomastix strix]|uniref:C2H2-type domain-containing protein n=1 Tax=Streblomastix strix TaxID=222440 RepID=A0A5J4WWD1_9EUKA|nr:MAG: hypothetical protein EZS28_005120 [Streblomastix strix]